MWWTLIYIREVWVISTKADSRGDPFEAKEIQNKKFPWESTPPILDFCDVQQNILDFEYFHLKVRMKVFVKVGFPIILERIGKLVEAREYSMYRELLEHWDAGNNEGGV